MLPEDDAPKGAVTQMRERNDRMRTPTRDRRAIGIRIRARRANAALAPPSYAIRPHRARAAAFSFADFAANAREKPPPRMHATCRLAPSHRT
ncbi:hypothetical protein GCM10023307_24150 [Lysobacter hankyongensis]|uniref:Uncharacterized protein n=1 Tax=Lysobacter hankyongensis TaxID=1176535 RepID=A0ABP9BPV4_9GAMM